MLLDACILLVFCISRRIFVKNNTIIENFDMLATIFECKCLMNQLVVIQLVINRYYKLPVVSLYFLWYHFQ